MRTPTASSTRSLATPAGQRGPAQVDTDSGSALWRLAQLAGRARVPTYWTIAAAAFHQYSTYRLATAAGVFTNSIVGLIRAPILFATITTAGGELSGFTLAQAATYVWLGCPRSRRCHCWGRSWVGPQCSPPRRC